MDGKLFNWNDNFKIESVLAYVIMLGFFIIIKTILITFFYV